MITRDNLARLRMASDYIDSVIDDLEEALDALEKSEADPPDGGSRARPEIRQEGRRAAVNREGVQSGRQGKTPAQARNQAITETLTQGELAAIAGHTGDCCIVCNNFTMRRQGPCLYCTTCGATTGCS